MLKRLAHGLMFGLGFGLAFVAVVYFTFVGVIVKDSTPGVMGGTIAEVVPVKESDNRHFELRKGGEYRLTIPTGGGILSITIPDSAPNSKRPTTIQAWVTESEAFLVRTSEEIPTVTPVPYPKESPENYASELVTKYGGFHKNNSTMPIDAVEVQRLKDGLECDAAGHLNGSLRITTEGIVFFVPNEFGT